MTTEQQVDSITSLDIRIGSAGGLYSPRAHQGLLLPQCSAGRL